MKVTDKINYNIFREYDLRGIYKEDLNEDVAYTIGRSFASFVFLKGETTVIVGHDNRISSPELSNALIKGLRDSGADVIDLGLVTTPMYYYARKVYKINVGIMITASHNPKEYNGFKIAFNILGNAYGPYIEEFRDFTKKLDFKDGSGNLTSKNIREDYIKLMTENINLPKKMKVVFDCGNGTGSIIIKEILDKLNIEYYPLYCDSDGNFPNHHPDPSVKENMDACALKVKELGYDIGIGVDGDADRVGIVDENGIYYSADMYMLAMYRYLNKNLKTRKALLDVKCSKTLIDELEKLDITPIMNRTGNSYNNMKMQEEDLDFGGEFSGHVWYRDKFPGFDDGIYAGLRMLEMLSNTNKKLSECFNNINKYYSTAEIKVPSTDDKKFNVVEKIKEYALSKNYDILTIDGVRANFKDGWALVRASNTSPNLTIRFEANTELRLKEIEKEFTDKINEFNK